MATEQAGIVEGSTALPNFVVIGSMRSGTTSLYRYLREHPQVFMRNEIHFFDERWDRGLDWYRTRFEGTRGETAVGDGTPTYMADSLALDRMARVIPDARLVANLRDPADRAYSHYWMEHARGRDPRTFEEAVDDEIAGVTPSARRNYLERGRYLPQLEEVCRRYDRAALHVVLFDDLHADPAGTYAGVCRHLGIDEEFRPAVLGERVNRFVSFRSVRLRNLPVRLPKALKIGRIVGKLNAVEGGYPPMQPETRARLRAHFAGHNAALERWLGRDLSTWAR